jgi:branched-chain amino acid transport system ATP-binding protein
VLSIRNVSAGYGPIEVVRAVNMEVAAGECVALIGWSGSGKTTLLKTVVGLLPATAGDIFYDGENITRVAAHLRVAKGIVMVPEGRHLFTGMSVYENILVGAHTVSSRADIERRAEYVFELFPILKTRRNQIAGTLSGGEQQMCAIARALMSAPRLLIIDELSLGLAPVVVSHLARAIIAIRRIGTTIVLVEQDAELATSIADRAYVIKRGQIAMAAASASLKNDPDIRRDFLWKAASR